MWKHTNGQYKNAQVDDKELAKVAISRENGKDYYRKQVKRIIEYFRKTVK